MSTLSHSDRDTSLGVSADEPAPRAKSVQIRRAMSRVRIDVNKVAERGALSIVFVGFVLAAASWPGGSAALLPHGGLDASWTAALAMAAHQGIHFGTGFAFTYGPLGFLRTKTLYYPDTAILGFLFRLALATATYTALVSAVRTRAPIAISVVVAYVAGFPLVAMWPGEEATLGLALILCVRILSRGDSHRTPRWEWIAMGSLAALMSLMKLSLGVGVGAIAAIALVCAPGSRRRAASSALIPAFAVFTVGWFGTRNGVSNLVAYFKAARATASGYTAMSLDPPARHAHDLALAAVGAGVIVVTAIVYARSRASSPTRRANDSDAASANTESCERRADATPKRNARDEIRRRAALGIVVATTVVSWILFKEAFVRQDGHRLVFFASIPLVLCAFMPPRDRSGTSHRSAIARQRFGDLLVVGVMVSATLAFEVGGTAAGFADPLRALRGISDTVSTLASSSRRNDVMTRARTALVSRYDLPADIVALTKGETVDIDPSEEAVAWAYPEMRWRPLPTVQDYIAFTPLLDRLDVDFIRGRNAPRFILRRRVASTPPGIVQNFNPPETQIAIECYYHRVAANQEWQLVERGADRCGTMTLLGTVEVAFGQRIDVPQAPRGDAVVASFDLHRSLWWDALDVIYKPPSTWIQINKRKYRFVSATAGELHLLRPASSLGYKPGFAPLTIGSFSVSNSGAATSAHAVGVTFYAMPQS